jgi:putative oxidoreductase
MIQRFLFGANGSASVATSLGLLVLRVLAGSGLALAHGYGKLPPSDRFVGRIAGFGLPLAETFAWGVGLVEFVGGLLIVVGLLTRPAALMIVFVMIGVFFLAHGGDFAEGEKAFVYAAAMLALALSGAGQFSLDAVIARRRGGYVERFRRR